MAPPEVLTQHRAATRTSEDEAFERLLLASAKLDAPSEGATQLALTRFATSTALVAASAPVPSSWVFRRTIGSVAKWLAVGTLVGGALAGAYLAGKSQVSPSRVSSTEPARRPASPTPAPLAIGVSSVEPPSFAAPSSGGSQRSPRTAGRTRATEKRTPLSAASPTSTSLAEEVERLDAARTALAIGDFNAVARELARYEGDFPHGVLAREADLVAISALRERGDNAEALRRARIFLDRYPRDVHAVQVRQLVSWQELTNRGE
jgi:hypothetical protein